MAHHFHKLVLLGEDIIILFIANPADKNARYMEVFRKAAAAYKGKVNFAWASLTADRHQVRPDEHHERIGNMIGLKPNEQPILVGVTARDVRCLRFTSNLDTLTV